MTFKYQIRVRLVIINDDKLLLEYVTDEDFYFYPGGRVENYETIKSAAEREMQEELGVQFTFKKILYIREFIEPDQEEHSLEMFVLGELDNYDISKNKDDPDYKENHEFSWVDINKLPDKLYPVTLTKKLAADFHQDFPNQGEYLGAAK
ncbi:NUDIX domain-containing protein [Patescibacteria group bacterium]|nr:NUDIX domain-containing protein [Patescibacteria group bacterium]